MSEISIDELETEQSMFADGTRHHPQGRHIGVERGVERYSPIQTGLTFLPFPIILGTVSTQIANLVRNQGFRG
jgi:hypothetical protein